MGEFLSNYFWLVLVLVFVGAFVWLRFGFYLRGIGQVDAVTANRMVDEERALIVDVREVREFDAVHIPDSRNLPLSQIRGSMKKLEKYRDRPLLVTCRSGSRSRRASVILKKNGFDEVYNLKGGITAWARAMKKGKI